MTTSRWSNVKEEDQRDKTEWGKGGGDVPSPHPSQRPGGRHGQETPTHKNIWDNQEGGGCPLPPNPPPGERVVMNAPQNVSRRPKHSQGTRHGSCRRPVGHTHTHTTAGTWTRATHTTHTCHTSQWASIPLRRDASIACWASWNGTARVNGYSKNDKIPEWDEMGVELDDGKLEFFKPPLLTRVCRVTARRQCPGGSSWQAGLLRFVARLLRVDQRLILSE